MIVYITHSHTYTEYILYTFITDEYVILILGKENKYHASSCISSWHTPQSLQCYNTKTLLYTRHYSIHTFYNSFPFFLHLFHTLSLSLSTSFLKKNQNGRLHPLGECMCFSMFHLSEYENWVWASKSVLIETPSMNVYYHIIVIIGMAMMTWYCAAINAKALSFFFFNILL